MRMCLFILCLAIALLSGCNTSIINDSSDINRMPTPVELVIWHTYSEEETRIFENEIIPLFEEEFPNIIINAVRRPPNDQFNRSLISRAAANKTPDIVRMDSVQLPFYAEHNLIYPVSNMEDFSSVKERFLPRPLETAKYKEKYYGLPLNTNTKVAIYNKALLQQAGMEQPPSSLSEVLEVARNNNYIILMAGFDTWSSLQYFYAFGGQLLDPTATKADGYFNSEASIEAMEQLLELYEANVLVPKHMSSINDAWEDVIDGKLLMIDEGPWYYSIRSEEKLSEIMHKTVSTPFPVTHGNAAVLGGENLVIMKGTKYLEESWQFLKWMTTSKPQELMYKTGLMPTNKDVNFNPLTLDSLYFQNFAIGLDLAFLRPSIAEWSKIDNIYALYMKEMYAGNIGIEAGLNTATLEIDKLLQQK
nr:extracellular solute-binding protein [Paenibacillus bovis]